MWRILSLLFFFPSPFFPIFPTLLVILKKKHQKLNESSNFVHPFWHLTQLGQENNVKFLVTNMGDWVPRTRDVLHIPHPKPFTEGRNLKCWLFFSLQGHWLGVQLVEMTEIYFFQWHLKMKSFRLSVPSTVTQNPDCPSTLFPNSVNFAYACILHVASQHHSCAGPIPQTSKQMNSHEKRTFLNSLCLDLWSLSDLPQLTPFHLACFPCLFVHFVVVFFINEILIVSLCDVPYASSFFHLLMSLAEHKTRTMNKVIVRVKLKRTTKC